VLLVGRLLVSLAVVLGVMWLVARRMRKGGRTAKQSPIEVLGRQQLSRHSAVFVVRVAEQALVVGVTDGSVSLLSTADVDSVRAPESVRTEADRPAPAAHRAKTAAVPAARSTRLSGSAVSPQTWRQTVDALRDLTSRA
jgi:flagellar protein FliO/FliZ